MDEAIKEIVNSSVIGALFVLVVVPLAIYAYKITNSLRKALGERTKDAKEMINKLLELNNAWNSTINDQVQFFETQKLVLMEIKEIAGKAKDVLTRINGRK